MLTLKQQNIEHINLTSAHNDFNKGLNAYAFFKINNRETGEDMVQETFLKTWKFILRGGNIGTMKSFLYHVLNNLIVDNYRKHKTTSLDIMIENGFEPHAEDANERLFNTLDGKTLIHLIPKLSKTYRKTMHIRYVQDLSLKEMSLITGQTRNAMSVQVHRGLEKLRVLYGHVDVIA